MSDHRIRLSDHELDLICSALCARAAALAPRRRREVARLCERLAECSPGSPVLRFGWSSDDQVVEPVAPEADRT